ncbi:hypothetical protein AB0J52_23405, partial [Spirillospora sp. NPDC049652]
MTTSPEIAGDAVDQSSSGLLAFDPPLPGAEGACHGRAEGARQGRAETARDGRPHAACQASQASASQAFWEP